jgi:hypothetical protein
MRIFDELHEVVKTAAGQLTNSSHVRPPGDADTREIHFSSKFQAVAKQRGHTQGDALDVYYHGYSSKKNMMVKEYNGYEAGIYYFVSPQTGRTVITSVWKREISNR